MYKKRAKYKVEANIINDTIARCEGVKIDDYDYDYNDRTHCVWVEYLDKALSETERSDKNKKAQEYFEKKGISTFISSIYSGDE